VEKREEERKREKKRWAYQPWIQSRKLVRDEAREFRGLDGEDPAARYL